MKKPYVEAENPYLEMEEDAALDNIMDLGPVNMADSLLSAWQEIREYERKTYNYEKAIEEHVANIGAAKSLSLSDLISSRTYNCLKEVLKKYGVK